MRRKIVQIDQEKCNGCGKCVTACVEGAIQLVNGKAQLVNENHCDGLGACIGECPQGAIRPIEKEVVPSKEKENNLSCPAFSFSQKKPDWPLQLALIAPFASFPQKTKLRIAADCCAFENPVFFAQNEPATRTVIACPKLDQRGEEYLEKLKNILHNNPQIKEVEVVYMEVPCCRGLLYLVQEALNASGREIQLTTKVVRIGENN
ncbi:ATP-binding protein [Atrimonas thermophila]|uniref:ATP-binding protein n=1 Tax=Atrimonas thermophila TaxID=3064161 RepID=UPI00399CEED2